MKWHLLFTLTQHSIVQLYRFDLICQFAIPSSDPFPPAYLSFSHGLRVSGFAQVRYLFAMDFLKSAVASAIAKGPAFPYSFGDIVDVDQSIWTLHNGTKRVRTHEPLMDKTDGTTRN